MPNPANRFLASFAADKNFSEILKGSFFSLLAQLTGTALVLIITLIVTRVFGAEMMGQLAIVQTTMILASIVAVLGMNIAAMRLIPEHLAKYSATSAFLVYRKARNLVIALSLVVSACLIFLGAPMAGRIFSNPQMSAFIFLAGGWVVFRAMMDLNLAAIRGLRQIKTYALMQVLPHGAMFIILLLLVFLSDSPNAPVYSQLAAWVLVGLAGTFILEKKFRQKLTDDDTVKNLSTRRLLVLSLPMSTTVFLNFIIAHIGIIVLGVYRPETEVGYYAVAVKLALLTSFILQAANSMAAPKFSELFYTGEFAQLINLAQKSAKLIFWSSAPLFFILFVFGKPLLIAFGEGFASAYIPLLILLAGQLVNSASGSTAIFMNMTGKQVALRNIMVIASILNLMLNFTLIPALGSVGCALATAFSLGFWNIWTILYIRKEYGKSIGYLPFPVRRNVA